MIAVNQVLTPKVTQGTVADEAVADPEIPFSNTLDELLEDSMTEFEAEDLLLGELEEGQLMAEQGLGVMKTFFRRKCLEHYRYSRLALNSSDQELFPAPHLRVTVMHFPHQIQNFADLDRIETPNADRPRC